MMKPVSSEENWWNDTDSSSDSSYSSSRSNDSSCPDWEEEVTPQGELFYVVRYPKPSCVLPPKSDQEPVSSTSWTNKKEPADKPSGILVKLIRRKSSKRSVRRIEETTSGLTHSSPAQLKEGDVYSVEVGVSGVTGWPKPNQSLLEARLGIIAEPHKHKLLIRAFSPHMITFYQPTVALGDWLCSIDNVAVNPENIDSFLENIVTPKDVTLKIKSMKSKKPNGSFLKKKGTSVGSLKQGASGSSVGWLVYVSAGCMDGNVTYRFPPRPSSVTPGAFLTLAHLLNTLTSSHPVSSTLCVNNEVVNVIYTVEGSDVLLVCLPQDRVSLPEAMKLNSDLVRCLKFNFQSLSRCFSSKEVNKVSLDELVSSFFRKASVARPGHSQLQYQFESLLPGAHFVPLPKKIQVQLSDALNELESNDIKEYEGKRLYSVVGTCLIHKGYVVRSQTRDLEDLGSFLRGCQLLDLTREGVQDLVLWREVYPSSTRDLVGTGPYTLQSNNRTFILAVAQEHDMLIVLYESGGCTPRLKANPGPDTVYVEEAQATLEHIQGLGFSKNLNKWFEMNENFRCMERTKSTDSQLSDKSSRSVRMAESQRQGSFEYPHISGLDMGVRGRSWSLPSVSAQALSRRLAADKLNTASSAEQQSLSLKSESDLSEETEMRDQRSIDSGSLSEWNDCGKGLMQEPASLPLARNGRVVQWVQLDCREGLILSSLDTVCPESSLSTVSSHYHNVINVFRRLAHQVHQVLINSACLRAGESADNIYPNVNKSVLALNEHGILFDVPTGDDKRSFQTYWVVGRLVFTPQPKELYVCYEDSCPQNMIELAFRLALNSCL